MIFLDELTRIAQHSSRAVVFAEAADARMIGAARRLVERRIADVILVGSAESIQDAATDSGLSLSGLRIIDPARDAAEYMKQFVEACASIPRPLKPKIARKFMRRPLMFGAMLVRLGIAHAMIAGATVPTKRVINAGLFVIGTDADTSTASSYFVMLFPTVAGQPEKTLIFADCAFNISPSASQLSEIAMSTAKTAQKILSEEPRIAMLSFSSKGSASHPYVDKVTEALSLVREQQQNLNIDGEFQFDAAFDARTARYKLSEPSPVAGAANVFIFPDLNAGNIGYKIAQYLGGAQAIGPILQGFAHPISDLSRGASTDDIVNTAIVLLAATSNSH